MQGKTYLLKDFDFCLNGDEYLTSFHGERDPWGGSSIMYWMELEITGELDLWSSTIVARIMAHQFVPTLTNS